MQYVSSTIKSTIKSLQQSLGDLSERIFLENEHQNLTEQPRSAASDHDMWLSPEKG